MLNRQHNGGLIITRHLLLVDVRYIEHHNDCKIKLHLILFVHQYSDVCLFELYRIATTKKERLKHLEQ